ncbi:hypothetical protein BDC45DRAFT_476657, partial [Circinella umbellata]
MQANRHSFLHSKRVRHFASKYARSITSSSSSISSSTATTTPTMAANKSNDETNSNTMSKSHNALSSFNNTEDDPNLTQVLTQYQSHLNKVHKILLQMQGIHDESPWKLEHDYTMLQGKCSDGSEITHEYQGQQAVFQTAESTRLKQILEHHRNNINPALYQCLFEAKLARITTQTLIDDTLWSLQNRPRLRMNNNNNAGQQVLPSEQEQERQQDLMVLRRLLHSLFAAERLYSTSQQQQGTTETTDIETEEVSAFIKDVRTWILNVSAVYLRLATLHDRIDLLLHLLKSPGTTQWAASLIQYIYRRDDQHWSIFMEEYLTMMSILFDYSLHENKPQWNEDDYLTALDQLGIVYTFSNQQYTNAMKRLAQIICKIAQVLMDRMCEKRNIKDEAQHYMDDFLVKVVDGYLQTQDAKVWHFLPALPFHAVSIRALWKIVWSLLDMDDYMEPQDLQHTLENLPNISKALAFLSESQIQGVTLKTTFARYVIEHLNYGYDEKEDLAIFNSQPWHSRKLPFLPYAIHEELAFMILDILRLYHPLPDSDKNANLIKALLTSAAARVAAASSHKITPADGHNNSIIEWSWKIALQLKLYDCTLSDRATDIENSITGSFIKDMLHGQTDPTACHGALVVYISFLLSPTSRHFLRFESGNGWDKLLLILRRSQHPEAVVQILGNIVPTFFYMHGDDFFNDENVLNFLRQMMDFKTDPMLVHAVDGWVPTEKTFAGSGFSYRDLVLHSWIKTVFGKKDWMWSDRYVSAMDSLCKIAFCLHRHDLVRDMLSEEQRKLQQPQHRHSVTSPKPSPSSSIQHNQHYQQQRNPLRMIKNMLPDPSYTSLLAGEWSLASVTTNNLFRAPGVEQDSLWFAFDVLTLETMDEEDERGAVAEASIIKSNEARLEKPIDFFTIYRWLQHILICPADHPLLPLFLQMFFSLYYANVQKDGLLLFYGHIFFEKKQDMIEKLRDKIAYLQTYHGQQQTDENNKAKSKQQNNTNFQERLQSVHHEDLRRIYYAMWLWLEKTDLLNPTFDMASLPKHYCPDLLHSCRRTDIAGEKLKPWQDTQLLWHELIQYDRLNDMFNDFSWIGADKFR